LNKIREEAKDKIMDEIKQETFNKQIEGTKEDLEEIIGINIKVEKYMVYIGYKLFNFYIYIYILYIYKHIYL
jgi:hypothetical protein